MMDDLIRRQDAIDALLAWEEDSFWDDECLKHRGEPYWIAPSDVIERMPSAQPEIIRCKDCKYCDKGIDEDGNPFLKCLGWVYGGTQKEDFCSHAERRTR